MRSAAALAALALLTACPVPAPPPDLSSASARSLVADNPAHAKPLDFTLKRFPGGVPFRLSSERGQVVLLDVWATWCEPCRDSLPIYQDLQKEFGARGLRVYAINVDADARAIAPFLEELKVQLPVLQDPEGRLAEAELKVKVMPTAYLLDRRGVVRSVHEGFAEEYLQKYLAEIEALLAERAK